MLKMQELWRREDGYLTIEAAFLVTLFFLLVLAIMMSGLYICDLNQAKSFLNRRVTELSLTADPYDSEAFVEDRNNIKSLLFVTDLVDFTISKTEKQVEGDIVLSLRMDIPMIGDWFGSLWTDRFSLKVDVGDNVDMMWRWEQIE